MLAAQHRLERLRVDGDGAAERAGHVDLHAGVLEHVVRRRHLAGEHARRLADVEHAVVRGDHERTPTGHVRHLIRLRILRVHPEALRQPPKGYEVTAKTGASPPRTKPTPPRSQPTPADRI